MSTVTTITPVLPVSISTMSGSFSFPAKVGYSIELPLTTPEAGPQQTVPPRATRHAHRRSAAVSHDLGYEPKLFYKLQGSSSTSLPGSSTTSLPEGTKQTSWPNKSGHRVSFLDDPKMEPVQSKMEKNIQLSGESCSNLSTLSRTGSSPWTKDGNNKPRKRNKEVKSWAGSLIKLGKKTKSNSPVETPSPQFTTVSGGMSPDWHSGSGSSDEEDSPEPIIDLDAALGPFKTPSTLHSNEFSSDGFFHRRSESAPELEPPFRNLQRMGAVVEEALEEESIPPIASPPRGGSPHKSPPRYYTARGYTGRLVPSPVLRQEQAATACLLPVPTSSPAPMSPPPLSPSLSSTDNEESPMESPAATIRIVTHLSDIPMTESTEGLDLGEPGPEVRLSVDRPIAQSRPNARQNRFSFISRESTDSKKSKLTTRVWKWIRRLC